MLTDENNKILAPSKEGASLMAGYTSSSSIVVFCAQKKPLCVLENSELRLWYWEDFKTRKREITAAKRVLMFMLCRLKVAPTVSTLCAD